MANLPGSCERVDVQSLPRDASRSSSLSPTQKPRTKEEKKYGVSCWQADEEVSNCPLCSCEFGIFTRKHHCRFCGLVICADCLKTKAVHHLTREPECVCDGCLRSWKEREASLDIEEVQRREAQALQQQAREEQAFQEQLRRVTEQSLLEQQQEAARQDAAEQHQLELAMEAARIESEEIAARKTREEKLVAEKLLEVGLVESEQPRDGNCQFHALVEMLDGQSHGALREQLVDWLEANADFQLNAEDDATALVHYLDFDPSWAAFCTRMRQPGQYGDHLTLIAAAECTSSQIVVFTSQAQGVNYHVAPRDTAAVRTINLVHYPLQMHFNLAQQLDQTAQPLATLSATPSASLGASAILQHLCARVLYVLDFPGQPIDEQRTTCSFTPANQQLSVGLQDLQCWVAALAGCAPNQVSLCWEDEERDLIAFDTEKELVAAVESIAARGEKVLHLSCSTEDGAKRGSEIDPQATTLEMLSSGESPSSSTAWVLVDE